MDMLWTDLLQLGAGTASNRERREALLLNNLARISRNAYGGGSSGGSAAAGYASAPSHPSKFVSIGNAGSQCSERNQTINLIPIYFDNIFFPWIFKQWIKFFAIFDFYPLLLGNLWIIYVQAEFEYFPCIFLQISIFYKFN